MRHKQSAVARGANATVHPPRIQRKADECSIYERANDADRNSEYQRPKTTSRAQVYKRCFIKHSIAANGNGPTFPMLGQLFKTRRRRKTRRRDGAGALAAGDG
mmetsp:Transcript_5096/g.16165  ORF Transcript_5096/g.16165 Transcript_5096/m.16165 type:complete len:103 (+) Transcript_5096:835-1143(+)